MKGIVRICALLAAGAAGTFAYGQGVLTDGNARFEFLSASTATTPGRALYKPDNGADADNVLFQTWWWLRLGNDTAETSLPWPPPSQTYVADTATLTWTGLRGVMNVVWIVDLTDGASVGQAKLAHALSITNTSANPLQLSLFHFADCDIFGASGASGDDASLLAPGRIRIEDQSPNRFCEFAGQNPNNFQVSAFPALTSALNNTTITNLSNTGLPATNIDVTAAYQWNLAINPGQTARLLAQLTINQAAQFTCPGDLNGDNAVNESDLGLLLQAWQTTAGGDADGDGDTDESDLGILLQNWQVNC